MKKNNQSDEKASLISRLKNLRTIVTKRKEEKAKERKISSKYKQLDLEEEANKIDKENENNIE